MKTIFSLFILMLFSFTVYSQKEDIDTVYIKGYKVVRYNKQEIESWFLNKKLREEGKSYKVAIDFEKQTFFIPIDSIKTLKDALRKNHYLNKKEVFFTPDNSDIDTYIKKICSISTDIYRKQVNLFNCDCNYYFIDNDNKYLYKIFYLEGLSLFKLIENNHHNKFDIDLSDEEIDETKEFFRVYFVFDIKEIDCTQNLLGLKIWQYESESQ